MPSCGRMRFTSWGIFPFHWASWNGRGGSRMLGLKDTNGPAGTQMAPSQAEMGSPCLWPAARLCKGPGPSKQLQSLLKTLQVPLPLLKHMHACSTVSSTPFVCFVWVALRIICSLVSRTAYSWARPRSCPRPQGLAPRSYLPTVSATISSVHSAAHAPLMTAGSVTKSLYVSGK